MENLIKVINKLQDVFSSLRAESIQLPQIVVIGSQSAGKSSVIESIVRRNFLPRGSGIVTRCPLILQLIKCPSDCLEHRSEEKGTTSIEEWGEFLHDEDKIFTDFDDIRMEIEDHTNELAGDNKGICSEDINLRIFSPNVVNLTLVDLPGITKVPVGDQPQNIEDQIKKLVFEKIRNPNSIILAVSAANVDLATSEALKFAKEVDPDGIRTLAVLTKLDLMDKGTDATEILIGKIIPVKLGIIGVVNRSQQSINEKKNIHDQLEMETEFLEANYPELASVNGTPFLEQELSQILIHHIKSCLPDLTERLNLETLKYQEKIKSLGKEVVDEKSAMIASITQFAAAYNSCINGTERVDKNFTTKLYKIMHADFEQSLAMIKTVDVADLSKIPLDSSSESRPTLFDMPSFDESFDNVVTKKIKLMHEPSKSCAQKVRSELQRLIKECGPEVKQEMQRFPKLAEKIAEVVNRMISERLEIIKTKIDDIIECQAAYTNKNHPQFDKAGALKLISKKRVVNNEHQDYLPEFGQELTTAEKKKVLQGLINNYLDVERTIVQDNVAKAIMCFMVNFIKKNIANKLLTDIFNPITAAELMKEPKGSEKYRRHAVKMLQALSRANEIIAEVSQSEIKSEIDSD